MESHEKIVTVLAFVLCADYVIEFFLFRISPDLTGLNLTYMLKIKKEIIMIAKLLVTISCYRTRNNKRGNVCKTFQIAQCATTWTDAGADVAIM